RAASEARRSGSARLSRVVSRCHGGAVVPVRYEDRHRIEPVGPGAPARPGRAGRVPGVPVSTVYDWRTRGLGPRAYRFGKHLKFAVSDVRIGVEQQRDLDPPSRPGGDPMSRPRLAIGTFGDIGTLRTPGGRYTARA